MTSPETPRTGFALPAAVFALVVVGVLVTGGFYVARQESRIGVASKHATQAFYLAERGVSDVAADPDITMLNALSMWGDTVVADTVGEGIWEVEITRMAPQTYFLDGTGTITRGGAILGGAHRRIGMIAKLFTFDLDAPAALTTQGSLRIGGSTEILGNDLMPSDWDAYCTDPQENKPGVMIDDTTNISYNGGAWTVDGDPALQEDSTLTADKLLDLGGTRFDDLARLADIEFPGTITLTVTAPDSVFSGGSYVCRKGSNFNWGDPLHPGAACFNYFPLIYAAQSLHISSSDSGQGILLVEGDLTITGGFEFFGPVIVKGTLSTTGTGGHIRGAVIAANVDLDTTKVLGNALVQFSSCSVSRALLNNQNLTRLRPLAQRSWVDLSNIAN